MKKTKIALILLLVVLLVAAVGCNQSSSGGKKTVYELSYYNGTDKGELSDYSEYNENLWRRNTETVSGADPFILDNTDIDGYYYLYATNNSVGFTSYRTKDFSIWESVGTVYEGEKGWGTFWAPEVATEKDANGNITYYLFFSSIPAELSGSEDHIMFVAKSTSPAGPFKLVDFSDSTACDGNVHADDVTDESFTKYTFFEYSKLCPVLNEQLGTNFSAEDLPSLIDSHPHQMNNGDKYIYFSLESPRGIVGMKLNNWLRIDYSTVTVLTRVGYYTMEDYNNSQKGEYVEINEYEKVGAEVNEGPAVIEHNGKYYLTFSVNGFYDASYSVMQAVADSPLGPYRKLGDDENGLFLSADMSGNAMLSGTGHHSFITIGDGLYICYHRHTVNGTINGGRMICVDELKWVEMEKDGEKLDVLYANGPTITVQPRFDSEAEYVNIATEGSVSLVSGKLAIGSSVDSLNDGLLSYNLSVSQDFLDQYVNETTSVGEATYEISFEIAREVRGFMVYGSKYVDKYFGGIYNVEITVIENGAEKVYYIKELNVDDTSVVYNEDELFNGNYVIENVVYGSGVYAEFNALNVKSIKFTTKLTEGQTEIGLSEIAVIGKRG